MFDEHHIPSGSGFSTYSEEGGEDAVGFPGDPDCLFDSYEDAADDGF